MKKYSLLKGIDLTPHIYDSVNYSTMLRSIHIELLFVNIQRIFLYRFVNRKHFFLIVYKSMIG